MLQRVQHKPALDKLLKTCKAQTPEGLRVCAPSCRLRARSSGTLVRNAAIAQPVARVRLFQRKN